MKKVFALMTIATVITLASCGGGEQSAPTTDTAMAMPTNPTVDTMHKDTVATTPVKEESAKKH